MELGDLRGALSACTEAIEKTTTPNLLTALAYSNLCAIKNSLQDPEGARAACDQAHSLDPRNPFVYLNRCGTNLLSERFDAALDDCSKAISMAPSNNAGLVNRCIAHYKLKNFEAAQMDCNAAIELSPQSLNAGIAYRFLGIMHATAHQFEATCAALEQGARLGDQSSQQIHQTYCL